MQRHVAILGAGPVGLEAALACADAGWTSPSTKPGDRRHPRAGLGRCPPLHPVGHERLGPDADPPAGRPGRRRSPPGPNWPPACSTRSPHCPPSKAASGYDPRGRHRPHRLLNTSTSAPNPRRHPLHPPPGHPRREDTAEADLVLDCTGTYSHPTPSAPAAPAPASASSPSASPASSRTRATPAAGRAPSCSSAQESPPDRGPRPRRPARHPCPVGGARYGARLGAVPDDTLPGRRHLVDTSRALADGANDRVTVHTGAHVQVLSPDGDRVRASLATEDGPREIVCDHVVALTGYTGDASLTGSCRSTSATPPAPR